MYIQRKYTDAHTTGPPRSRGAHSCAGYMTVCIHYMASGPYNLSVYLSIYLSIYLSSYLSIYLAIYVSIYQHIYMYINIYTYICIYSYRQCLTHISNKYTYAHVHMIHRFIHTHETHRYIHDTHAHTETPTLASTATSSPIPSSHLPSRAEICASGAPCRRAGSSRLQ